MRLFIAVIVSITFIFACATSKKGTSAAVPVVTLYNYVLNPGISFQDDIHYAFIGNESSFHKMFSMTRSSLQSISIPNFQAQSVVAIVLKPTDKVVSVAISKAEIEGKALQIYYSVTDTTSWKNYVQTPMVIATVPKNINVKQVRFISNGIKEKTIAANY